MIGLISQIVVLGALATTVGIGPSGWVAGLAFGAATGAALSVGLTRAGRDRLGPADRVTLVRAALVGGVAALVADSFNRPAPVTVLVALAGFALLLDAVDGWVARRTSTVSRLGARFDMEVDAFLILVLSVYVARSAGAWVLAIGGARYAFVAARLVVRWMRGSPPPRHWCKVVAAIQGIVLTVAAADVISSGWTAALLLVSLALLTESFGREVWWLWRHREAAPGGSEVRGQVRGQVLRRVRGRLVTAVACLLVWVALVVPNQASHLTPAAFVRVPLEAVVLVVLALMLPARLGRVVAGTAGVVLGAVAVVKVLDMGFLMAFGRPFNPMVDWTYLGSGFDLLTDSIGRSRAVAVLVTAGVVVVGVLVLVPLAVLRLSRVVERHRRTSIQTVSAVGAVWVLCAVLGLQIVPGEPVASTSAAGVAFDQVGQVRTTIENRQRFVEKTRTDPFKQTPAADLLTALRGKDVIFAFVESYGRVAVEDSAISKRVVPALDAGTRRLRSAGFSARSAFLTSSTFGGLSWLAHATLQSGLWVDNQLLYDDLLAGDRFTLTAAFERAGWRTVLDAPANTRDWPEGRSFYHYDQIYDSRNVGYAGPKFSYATMPDQYVLSAFQRLELAPANRAPVMAEIDLITSHTPWAPLPRMVDWDAVGDGSVFDDMPDEGESADDVWRDRDRVRAAYTESIEYSLEALISFVETFPDDDLVLVMVGDHQPATVITGDDASRDVPISVIARDPAVLDRISGWDWQSGLRPRPDAPVWPMDAFRDRFLTAYGPSQ